MAKRIAAIVLIFLCATAAWMILGATIFFRTQSSNVALRSEVASIWGTTQKQTPATACYDVPFTKTEESEVDGRKIVRTVKVTATKCLPLESSRLQVHINLEPRQKGLLWYRTYKVGFAGDYVFRNISDHDQQVTFSLPLPADKAVYDDMILSVNGAPLAAVPLGKRRGICRGGRLV